MRCELCGTRTPRTSKILIEGTLLSVCSSCMKFGESGPSKRETKEPPTVARRLERRQRRMRTRDVFKGASAEALAADYPVRIRSAREKINLSQKELAVSINEKWSIINKLEAGDMRPSDSLVSKLERALDIKLREKVEEVHIKKQDGAQAMTLADLLKEE
ncbi:MAG: multiprotein bridging factor aMBF1 [Candidatus Thermoplasmatota archaeon]|nr:multiprotein bridging factor aMBF1 [Candidatus Thermoplasmatota archaeon]